MMELREQIANKVSNFAHRTLRGEMVGSFEFADEILKIAEPIIRAEAFKEVESIKNPYPKYVETSFVRIRTLSLAWEGFESCRQSVIEQLKQGIKPE